MEAKTALLSVLLEAGLPLELATAVEAAVDQVDPMLATSDHVAGALLRWSYQRQHHPAAGEVELLHPDDLPLDFYETWGNDSLHS